MKRIFCLGLIGILLLGLLPGCEPALPGETTQGTQQTEPESTKETTQQNTTENTNPGETNAPASQVLIHEIMPNNRNLVMGHELDWVELFNQEDTAVSLNGYALTDDLAEPNAHPLNGLEIAPGGYLVITLSDNAGFKLAKEGETVYLTYGSEVISQLTYGLTENGEAIDQAGICAYPTPGYANTEAGYLAYLEQLKLPDLIISEAMTSNSKYNPIRGKCYDWVEIKNNSNQNISLKGWCLSDKRSHEVCYGFPDVTLKPGEHYLVYCSGETKLGANHAPFKLSADGETVYLGKNHVNADALVIPGDLPENHSFGRSEKVPSYQKTPTPGAQNTEGYLTDLAVPNTSAKSGLYDGALSVTLSAKGTIYYTCDGSNPTTSSAVYSKPIPVNKTTTIRTFCVEGERVSAVVNYTYVIGPQHELPVVSVAIPQDKLTGSAGVLNHIDKTYEYEAVLTLIENGQEQFSIPFGFRLHGNDSRKGDKQNFQLRFRSEYGAGKLHYRLFENRDITEFNSLLLKGGSEDWNRAMMRDELLTSIADGTTELYTQAYKPVVLYLGGEYWGVYYLRERYSDDYVASHMNVSTESVDLVKYTSASTQAGSNADFKALRTYIQTHDMTKSEHYAYVAERVNMNSLMDWYICRSYMGDADLDNVRRCRSSETDNKWYWMYFDLDWGFLGPDRNLPSRIFKMNGADKNLFLAVLKSQEGKDAFLKRYAHLLKTALNETHIIKCLENIEDQIRSEMPRDRERWGKTMKSWETNMQKLRDFVKDDIRTEYVLKDLQKYFSLTDAQMESYFAGL